MANVALPLGSIGLDPPHLKNLSPSSTVTRVHGQVVPAV
jgi:hypothetical protein